LTIILIIISYYDLCVNTSSVLIKDAAEYIGKMIENRI